jgi:stage II sporulation protein D
MVIKLFDIHSGAIRRIPLEDLVAEILVSHIPMEFDMEAIKAQAVLIRTNILRQSPTHGGNGCQAYPGAMLCNTGHCIEWTPRAHLQQTWGEGFYDKWERAVEAAQSTRGRYLAIAGRPINAYYHTCCGGATENSENILGNKVLYLRRVLCDHCRDSTYWEQQRDITIEELEQKLGIKLKPAGPVDGAPIEGLIDHIERDSQGRIKSLRIGGKSFRGSDFKELLGLSSTRFGWDPVTLRFYSRGSGHGLGMCQCGADAMAREGKGYQDILCYYFTGVGIETMQQQEADRPLKGRVFVIDPGHGGQSGDNVGPGGLREKDVNLDIARKLVVLLEKSGAQAYLTRGDDRDLLLSERAEMANTIRPHFFISIHQNGFYHPGVSGAEAYYYDGDLEGERLGRMIMLQLVKDLGVADRGVKTANFYLLREIKVASVLVEPAYITNPAEEQKLRSEQYRADIAEAILKGIIRYYIQ